MPGNIKHCVRHDVHGPHTWKLNDVVMHCRGTVLPPAGGSQPDLTMHQVSMSEKEGFKLASTCDIPTPHQAHDWIPVPDGPGAHATRHCKGMPLPAGATRTAPCGSSQPHGAHIRNTAVPLADKRCPGLTGKAEDETERAIRQLRERLDTAVADIADLKRAMERLRGHFRTTLEALEDLLRP